MKYVFFLQSIISVSFSRISTMHREKVLKNINGFIEDPLMKDVKEPDSDLKLISYNMETNDYSLLNEQVLAIEELLTTKNPTVLAIQEMSKKQKEALLASKIRPHFDLVVHETTDIIDTQTGRVTFLPFIYDTTKLQFLKGGVFKTTSSIIKNSYASYAMFSDNKLNLQFTVINLNLYSTRAKVDDLELASILSDIKHSPEIQKNLIIFLGTINALSKEAEEMLKRTTINLNPSHRKGLGTLNTVDIYNDAVNNIERDFARAIAPSDVKVLVTHNYILNLFKHGLRFPIEVGINVVQRNSPQKK